MRTTRLLLLAALALTAAPLSAQAAPAFDHGGFDALLRAHVAEGLVSYRSFAAAPEFDQYLARLAQFDPRTLPREERLAFWINAYNAYTIRLIIKHRERKSIRNINKSLGFIKGSGPWNERLAVVGDSAYTLDEIEHGIIRPEFQEPRIHFALVCAALGCPPLRSEAYTGDRLEEQLDDQARIFLLHSPGKNRVDPATGTVFLSPVFKFRDYEKDFGGSREAVARYIARWWPAGPERDLLEQGAWKRWEYTHYDWALNGQGR